MVGGAEFVVGAALPLADDPTEVDPAEAVDAAELGAGFFR